MTRRQQAIGILVVAALFAGGCAAGRAFRQGQAATKAGDVDQAVAFYRRAVQAAPDNTNYKIALERAMLAASRTHLDRAKDFEQHDQLDAALSEYRLAAEYDPSNRLAAAQAAALEQTIRNRLEAARPPAPIEQARQRANQALEQPLLNPASREPLVVRFNNTNLKDVLSAIGGMTGINIVYDRDVTDRTISLDLNGVTLEEALNQIMTTNQLSYKVQSERSILVFPDTTQKHQQYDEQVIRTFYISHADATELVQLLSVVIRLPSLSVVPAIAVNRTNNSITVRATAPVVQIIQKIIEQNDKPRAEIVFDVEILEVDTNRAKQYGLNLSEFAIGSIFSPETVPPSGTGATGTTSTQPSAVRPPAPFNLNTVSNGVSTSDFYLAVPTAVVRFLESDSHTRLVAKPQIRGAEGQKITLNLGDEIPVVTTSYTPIATGGGSVNPLNSYQYKNVGINLDITPRVTLDGDVLIDLNVESSSRGTDVNVAGTSYPSFGSRKVGTRLRLRDGEPNLLAGLFRQDEQSTVTGFPGAVNVPGLKQLLSGNDEKSSQTDIVMLLTPHIVRTSEVTADDLMPIYIGSQQNLGVGGAPPTIVSTSGPDEPAIAPAPQPPAATRPGDTAPNLLLPSPPSTPGAAPVPGPPAINGVISTPPGSSPVPGTVVLPPAPTTPQTAQPAAPTPAAPSPAANASLAGGPTPEPAAPVAATTSIGSAVVQLSVPPVFAPGGGPYTVPITIANVARLSTITLTVTFDPARLSVRSVQEGSFMRSGGGGSVNFVHQVAGGRLDITISRAADTTGATGSGLLAAILFDAVSPGTTTLSMSGSATGPGGTAMGLQFRPATVTVQ